MAKNKSDKKTVVLLDCHAILHRAYHALPDFSSSKGEATGALYGLSTMLFRIIEEFKPDYIFACFDLPKPTYRHEAYADYKAGRKKADEELISQIIRSRDIFKALNIPMYEKEGFEADDMLGTIVEKLKGRKDIEIIIASGDMDTMQLIDGERVKVFTLKKGIKDTVLYGERDVVARFGFTPPHLTDYKGLRGDPSDNIIGIKGIGEKTAENLIKEFGTIEQMYEALDLGSEERFKRAGISPRVLELIKNGREEAVFSKMLATIRRDAPIDFELPKETWIQCVSTQAVKSLFSDLEFRSLLKRVDEVCGGGKVSEEDAKPAALFALNHSVDEKELKRVGVALWLLDSSITNPTLEDIFHFAKTQDFAEASKKIFEALKARGLSFVFEEIEEPLIEITRRMGERGIKIDAKKLISLSKEYHKSLFSLEKEIWEMAGEEFNISSPKQLSEILFDKMKLQAKGLKKTAGGARSTKESELEKLAELHPIIEKIMDYRELSKLLGTYIDNIPGMLDKQSRLHATFIQTGAVTGRMASQNPGLQNIPIKTELGRNIRHAFIAEDGFLLAALDYSQIELRIAAFLSNDKKLIEIFKSGEDVHAAVASRVFKVPLEKVDKEMRRKAKVINFGILYGMGVNALKKNLGSTREEAQNFYDDYFNTFKELAAYLDHVKAETRRLGYTTTFFGRRRYFEGINSKLPFIRASAERMAINAPIQGTQADITKLAMVRIDEYIKENKLQAKAYLLLQIHDELVYEIVEKDAKKIALEFQKIMEEVFDDADIKEVPIKVNASIGKDWGSMESLKQ
ncbi:MAG TPA: DNA polymerase [Candidatus Paceibacterota bacterium]|nr:DNA polymerase [Candidatus Paceibacterota bacterium]